MSREIKRVAKDFQWPLSRDWPGYKNPFLIDCPVCDGDGCSYGITDEDSGWCVHPSFAVACREWAQIEPPTGDGYQMWQTVSEGAPVSPVFDTMDDLITWMIVNKYSGWAVEWVREGKTWLPSGMGYNGALSFVQDHS